MQLESTANILKKIALESQEQSTTGREIWLTIETERGQAQGVLHIAPAIYDELISSLKPGTLNAVQTDAADNLRLENALAKERGMKAYKASYWQCKLRFVKAWGYDHAATDLT